VTVTSIDGTMNSDPDSLVEPVDYTPVNFVASWAHGDATPVVVPFMFVQDLLPERNERFTVVLGNPTNGLLLGADPDSNVTVFDDDDVLQIDNPFATTNGLFGASVAKVGRRIAIGAPGNALGAGRVFLHDVDIGTLFDTLDGGPGSQSFGWSLSFGDLDALAVGGAGNAWCFGGNDALSVFTERFMVASADAGFGSSVFVNGGRLRVGAPQAQIGGALTPSGRVYSYHGVLGTPDPVIEGAADNRFGTAFASTGNDLWVSAAGNDGNLYQFTGSPLGLVLTIPNPFPDFPPPDFGASIATSGGMVIVGSPGADTFAPNDGRVYLFNGGPPQVILPPGPLTPDGEFGANVLSVPSQGLICVQQRGAGAVGAGRVWVFNSSLNAVAVIDCPLQVPDADFGASMCEFDGALVVTAPNTPGLIHSGTVFIVHLP
jgi:hypothetical protein